VKQIETPRLPDPIMRRPPADREEKRVAHVNETSTEKGSTGQLDVNDPNQRRLLAPDDGAGEEHSEQTNLPMALI
jgi:hypothetical protein